MRKEVRKILKINRKLVSRGDQDLVYRPLKAVYQAGYLPGGQGTIITELYKYTPSDVSKRIFISEYFFPYSNISFTNSLFK